MSIEKIVVGEALQFGMGLVLTVLLEDGTITEDEAQEIAKKAIEKLHTMHDEMHENEGTECRSKDDDETVH